MGPSGFDGIERKDKKQVVDSRGPRKKRENK